MADATTPRPAVQQPLDGTPGAEGAGGAGLEVEALRARVAELEQDLAQARATASALAASGPGQTQAAGSTTGVGVRGDRSGRWRPVAVAVLLVLSVPLAISTVLARWAHNEIGNTDRYVATVAPLATDPVIQQEMATKITTAIFERFDVQAVTEEAVAALAEQGLPPRAVTTLNALTVPLANGIESFVSSQVTKLIRSDAFAEAWVTANEEAHTQLVAVLTGEGTDTITVSGNTVSLNLAALINTVKQQLIAAGFTLAERIPTVNASFTLLESDELGTARSAFSLLSTLAVVLPLILLLVIGLAVYLARDRRRALLKAMLTVAFSMLLLGLTLNLLRPLYLDSVPPEVLSTAAAGTIYDALIHFLRLALRLVLAVSLLIALVAWLAGPSAPARGLRRVTVRGARGVGSLAGSLGGRASSGAVQGVDSGAAGTFARAHLLPLRIGVVGLALLLIAVVDAPSAGYVVTLLVLGALGWLAVEFLARTAPEPAVAVVPAEDGPAAPDEALAVPVGASPTTTIDLAAEQAAAESPAGPRRR